jgi:hypothetical protein
MGLRIGCWWIATAAITSATPSRSWTVGSWARTSMPMTVAQAGRMLSINANVARRSRAMASWSVT